MAQNSKFLIFKWKVLGWVSECIFECKSCCSSYYSATYTVQGNYGRFMHSKPWKYVNYYTQEEGAQELHSKTLFCISQPDDLAGYCAYICGGSVVDKICVVTRVETVLTQSSPRISGHATRELTLTSDVFRRHDSYTTREPPVSQHQLRDNVCCFCDKSQSAQTTTY